MSSVHALFPHDPTPPKRTRVDLALTAHDHKTAMEINASQVSYGSVSLIGRRRMMEDAMTIAPSGLPCAHEFFGVYDGHGGPRVSVACHERLHLLLADEIALMGEDWPRVMKTCFRKMDDVVQGFVNGLVEDGFDGGFGVARVETTGSTATVAMVGDSEIIVANCGDSRAVLFHNHAPLPLSSDHKPDLPEERRRLESSALGFEIDLPVSRAIGHHGHVAKQCLIPDPEVKVLRRTESDKFLIIATHGLWDVVSNEDACEVVKKCLDGRFRRSFDAGSVTSPVVAATTLAELAMARGSRDNISLIVVEL